MHYILGVDSGGTKTEAVLLRPDGTVAGWGRVQAIDQQTGRDGGGRSDAVVQAAVRQALGETAIERLHIVNTGNGLPIRLLLPPGQHCRATLRNIVESDSIFCLVPPGPAIVALAGTGSHVAGRDGQGNKLTLDGLGPYIGDLGGAVSIGLEGMRAAVKSDWHPRHRTILNPRLYDAVKEICPTQPKMGLVTFMYLQPDRWKVAAMARWVDEAAEEGDVKAQAILRQAGRNNAEVIYDMLYRLDLLGKPVPLIGIGSVITNSRLFWQAFRAAVATFAPRVTMARLCLPPVACHALSTLADHPDFPTIRARLRQSLSSILGREIIDDLDYT